MALNRQKTLQAAERMLKQGKVQAALTELEQLAEQAPSDLLTLNRMGDLLARQGRHDEATAYYERIADQFTRQGFYPKAIAIQKKILRLHPQRAEVLLALGDLYVEHRVPGEARNYYMQVADNFVKERDFVAAREVYEKLVAAEPEDPRHRARLAESRAAAGENDMAADELVRLGQTLFEAGKPEDAEQSFRRAHELMPDKAPPIIGIANCLTETGRPAEALVLLEEKTQSDSADPTLTGEVWWRYESVDRFDDARALLSRVNSAEMPLQAFERVFEMAVDRGRDEALWERVDPLLDGWAQKGNPQRSVEVLEHLGDLEKKGYLPALKRLHERVKFLGDRLAMTKTLERLHKAYRLHQMEPEAAQVLEELREVAPKSPLVAQAVAAAAEPVIDLSVDGAEAGEDAALSSAEAPAVPLNRADEEFVTGGMTQTEILEKYGLNDQALAQVQEVTSKFPGHVGAQEKRVTLLRNLNDKPALQQALVELAVACRASGEVQEASRAVAEAREQGGLLPATEELLARLGLVGEPATPSEQFEAAADEPAFLKNAPPEPVPAMEQTEKKDENEIQDEIIPIQIEATRHSPDDGLLIDFDAMDDDSLPEIEIVDEAPAAASIGAPPEIPVAEPVGSIDVAETSAETRAPERQKVAARAPGEDMLEEIRTYLDNGMVADAARRVVALRALGYGSPSLDALDVRIAELTPPEQPAPATPSAPPAAAATPPVLDPADSIFDDDDDLSSITSALEDELFAAEEPAKGAEAESEQSLQEVFAAFKSKVSEQVDDDDFRTHYDLGIGYKEMGLMSEAIGEFEIAVKDDGLIRDAATMLAICHRELEQAEHAIRWFRRAIEASPNDVEVASGLRYELAETLLQVGDRQSALDTFRDVLEADPAYRDVETRVAELESTPPA